MDCRNERSRRAVLAAAPAAGPAAALAATLAVLLASCSSEHPTGPPGDAPPERSAYLSGGETTIFNATSQAFTFPAPNLADLGRHLEGDLAFDASFVASGEPVHSGLGPIFNSNACTGCHIANGRGRPVQGSELGALLLRLSVPGSDPRGGPLPVPGFGIQLNDKALFGVQPEARVDVTVETLTRSFADGTTYILHRPVYRLVDPYVPLPVGVEVSPRLALPVFGRGLLEAIDEQTLLDLAAAPRDDGISGRPNRVLDVASGTMRLGRFGWKANQPSLVQQAAAAYRNDMGVTNPLFPVDSAHGQPQHDGRSDDPEIPMETVELAAFYTQTLAVPARRNLEDPQVRQGESLFERAGCTGCHVPELTTGVLEGVPSVSNQRIRPYTDLLLHDMGNELADGRPDHLASGSEWRTPPLWGLGLVRTVQGTVHLLHDGRARSLLEAVMWHGGEAEAAREAVRTMSADERAALVAFLESL